MDVPKLHLGIQDARALLLLLREDLERLEQRTARHATRLRLSEEDQGRMDAALATMQRAQEEVKRLFGAAAKGGA